MVGGTSNTVVSGTNSVSLGGGSTGTSATGAVAIGSGSVVSADLTKASGQAMAIGYQATASKAGTIAFGHDAGDVSGYTITWEQRTDKDAYGNINKNADGTTNDYTKPPKEIKAATYDSAYYNRLVKVADGVEEHDAVTLGQLQKAIKTSVGETTADGNYIKKGNAVSTNLGILDAQTKTNTDDIAAIKTSTGTLDADGNYIRKNNTLSGNLGVLDAQTKTNTDDIAAIKTSTGTLDADGNYIRKNNTLSANLSALDTQAKTNADGIAANKSAIGTLDNDGNYIRKDNSVSSNLGALDAQAKTNADGIAANKSAIGTLDNDGNYIRKDSSVSSNLGALDTQAKTNADGVTANRNAIEKESTERQAADSRLNTRIDRTREEVDNLGAMSMAIAGLHPLSYEDGDARFQLAAALGTYDGRQAIAAGGFYHFNQDSMLSFGMTTDTRDFNKFGANIGYAIRIGHGGTLPASSNLQTDAKVAALENQVRAQNEQLASQKEEIASQNKRITELEEMVRQLAEKK